MRGLKWLLPALTLGLIALIWLQSLMPADLSQQESGLLLQLIKGLLPFSEALTEHTLRKTAHFTEYALLGALLWADIHLYSRNSLGFALAALYICLLVAVTDEIIQLFAAGRSSSVVDVAIDHFGSLFGYGLMCLAAAVKTGAKGGFLKKIKKSC